VSAFNNEARYGDVSAMGGKNLDDLANLPAHIINGKTPTQANVRIC
jgi:hypothetical protein